MLNGWDGYILTHADYVKVFFSHDEYIDFLAKLDENLVFSARHLAECARQIFAGHGTVAKDGAPPRLTSKRNCKRRL